MTRRLAPLALVLTLCTALPSLAADQGAPDAAPDTAPDTAHDATPEAGQTPRDDARSRMQRGMEMFLDGLSQDMAPAWEGLRDHLAQTGPKLRAFIEQMGPALADLLDKVDDLSVYEAPEMLPNGDIIMRRKTPLAPNDNGTETPPDQTPDDGAPKDGGDSAPGIDL